MSAGLALAGCTAGGDAPAPEPTDSSASSIHGGYDDESTSAVVGVAGLDEDGHLSRICSGALIAPNLVLTAQHCVSESPKRIACDVARFGAPFDPSGLRVTLCGAMRGQCESSYTVREVVVPPGDGAVCGRDIALIVLDEPVLDDATPPLPPRLDEPPEPGEVYSAVGFGRTGTVARDSGFRRRRDGLQVACVGAECNASQRIKDGEWQGEGGPCRGDSGGPALDVTGAVIGVDSRGLISCERPIYSGLTAHRDWLVAESARAARLGRYETPTWADVASGKHLQSQ